MIGFVAVNQARHILILINNRRKPFRNMNQLRRILPLFCHPSQKRVTGIRKDGKEQVYDSICESLRVHGGRTVQRQMLHLGELNPSQCESWQRTLEVVSEQEAVATLL